MKDITINNFKPEDIAFVTCCHGQRYIEQQGTLIQSIYKFYPYNPIFIWTDELPAGARPMYYSLYGFKPHAVNQALDQGYKKIVWFDTAIVLMDKLDVYQNLVKDYGVIAVQDENKLTGKMARKALKYFDKDWNYIADKHLVGGSFYYFDFDVPLCQEIFNKWIKAEQNNMFGSQEEEASGQLQGHRADEAVMSLCLYTSGSKPYQDPRYNCENNPIMVKRHFK